jgi:membrane associated rhomboid family serine protease
MIPLIDNLPSPPPPIVTYGLIGLILGVFAWEVHQSTLGHPVLLTWGLVPARLVTTTKDALSNNPAAWVAWLLTASGLLKAIFLHGSYAQVLGNLIFLWVFGRRVEAIWGGGKFLSFYLGIGVFLGLVQILLSPQVNTSLLGANGAIAALIGAYLVAFPTAKIATILPLGIVFIPLELPALFFGFWWFIQQTTYSIGQLSNDISMSPTLLTFGYQGLGLILGAGVMGLELFRRGGTGR